MDEITRIWPQWKIEELIGRGAYGRVYKVRREEQGHVSYAAVKVVEIPQDESEIRELLSSGMDYISIRSYYQDMIRALTNEIHIMDALKTAENIVSIENFHCEEHQEEIGWTVYIQMELLESLTKYIQISNQEVRKLSNEEIVKLGIDICSALVCCEQENVIHRDIKPDNIFRNKYGTYKLGDFGVSKQMEKTQGTMSQKGTSMYMAPEIHQGNNYGHTVDIYSLGITLYKLLNGGRFPYYPTDRMIRPGDSDMAHLKRMRGEKMEAPCEADSELSRIVLKACAFKPYERYQHAQTMKNDLEEWMLRYKYENNSRKNKIDPEQKEEKIVPPESMDDGETWNVFGKKQDRIPHIETEKEQMSTEEKGSNVQMSITLTAEEAEKGCLKVVEVNGKRVVVPVPKNTTNHEELVITKNGNPGINGGENGDLYVHVIVVGEDTTRNRNTLKQKIEVGPHAKKIAIFAIVAVILIFGIIVLGKKNLYHKAETALNDGKYEESLERYRKIIDKYPDELEGYLGATDVNIAMAEVELGEYRDSMDLSAFEKAMIYYNDALEYLDDANQQGIVGSVLSDKYDEINKTLIYYDYVSLGDDYLLENKMDNARELYMKAIDTGIEQPEAYCAIVKTYINQNSKEQALEWLNKEDVTALVSSWELEKLKQEVYLNQINVWLKRKEYKSLRDWFLSEEADDLFNSAEEYYWTDECEEEIYFQNNKRVDSIESGKGLIVSEYGAYLGEISACERKGEGRQFGIDYYDDQEKCFLYAGDWENDKANGEGTYIKFHDTTADGDRYKFKYEGDFKDNMLDGKIKFTWKSDDAGKEDWATITADNGTFECIRKEGDKYVYAQSDYTYWSYPSEEALQNHMIWNFY